MWEIIMGTTLLAVTLFVAWRLWVHFWKGE
jgi:hypothetical protein